MVAMEITIILTIVANVLKTDHAKENVPAVAVEIVTGSFNQ
ncbi:hypothetical protein [Oceanobacillus jeddahense]|uniref:Uncharacterized protein n=1 Tax=Oceanobacillus jeddahense TaxID=1462527 RepID=A0ABY5K0U9_9BACI|nr:hypothetical protein [Oceanobacillus jeddahense]UUI05665.1 hypothetical protein NP439_10700 [Oceanobacillus jeddahense]